MSKTVIITGATGNLGKATVSALKKENYKIVAPVIPGEEHSFKGDSLIDPYPLDLLKESDVAHFVKDVVEKYKTIDAALLLAGGYAGGSLKDTSGNVIREMYALNFETAYFLVRPVFQQMVKQNSGRIVMIGSRPAMEPQEGKGSVSYALSKSLLFNLAAILNAEGKSHNVVTTVVVPSILDTPSNRDAMPQADFSEWVSPQEVADIMQFIISDKASSLRDTVLKVYGKV